MSGAEVLDTALTVLIVLSTIGYVLLVAALSSAAWRWWRGRKRRPSASYLTHKHARDRAKFLTRAKEEYNDGG